MNAALTNLIMPIPTAAPSSKAAPNPKRSASSQADKSTNFEAKPAQVGKSARKAANKATNSKDAPDTTKKAKAHSGLKAPDGKVAKVKNGEKVVVEALGSGQVFSEIIQSVKASGKFRRVGGGESTAEVLTKEDVGTPDVVLAGKTQAVKFDTDSLQVRVSILDKVQVAPAAHKPAPEGQAVTTSEFGENSVGGNTVGEMRLDTEGIGLPSRTPIKVNETLAEVVSPDIGVEKPVKSQAGSEATGGNQQVLSLPAGPVLSTPPLDKPFSAQVLTSPAGPVLSALAEGMKQVSDAPRVPTSVAGEKSALTASSVTSRKMLSPAGLTPNVSSESVDGMDAGIKIDTLLRGSEAPVVAVGQRQTGHGETTQEVLQHLGVASEPVRVDTVDTPTVSSENSLPAPAANQVVEALRASAARQGQQVVIHLNPPELGKVSIRLNVTGDEVRGVLRVDNPQTLTQLQREAPALLSRLAEAGVQLKQMDLSLSQQGAGDSSLYSQMRDDSGLWGQDGQDQNSQSSASELLSDEHVLFGVEETLREMTTLADDAINVWI